MNIVKVIGIAFVGLLCVGVLREVKPSLAVICGIVTGIIIVYVLLDDFTYLIAEFNKLAELAAVDNAVIKVILKIIGIGYLTEFASNVAEDYGSPSIAKKIQFGGKICIAVLAVPIITGIVTAIGSIAK